jgi:hypothetical protein
MYLGLGLRLGSSTVTGFDADAAAYFDRAGVTDATGKAQINAFVKGIKALGLYNSMLCWPLRSTQNSGTGTTAYSLGGLGIFNGTLTNGPTWGTDGITFDGTNDRIALPNNSFGTGNSPMSAFCFFKPVSTAAKGTLWATGNGFVATDVMGPNINDTGNDVAAIAYTSSTIAASDTTMRSILCGNTSLGFKGKNGGTVTSFTLSNALNKGGSSCGIGCLTTPTQDFFAGFISAVIRFDQTPTTQLNSDVYTLYKNTLGTGLGLP